MYNISTFNATHLGLDKCTHTIACMLIAWDAIKVRYCTDSIKLIWVRIICHIKCELFYHLRLACYGGQSIIMEWNEMK